MRRSKDKNKKLIIGFGCICAIVVCGLELYEIRTDQTENELKRDSYVIEDSFNTSRASDNWKDTIEEQGLDCLFWSDSGKKDITNRDYQKSIRAKTIVLCGNSAILYPNENYISEEGYCLLGRSAAVELFGSSSVSGRSIYIEGKEYYVAGILQKQKDIVLIESDEGNFENVTYLYHDDFEKGKNLQIIEGICGSRLSEAL